jgi:hypothetical protein
MKLIPCSVGTMLLFALALDRTPAQSGAPLFPGAAYAVGTYPTCVAIGDLNGDGKRDLVATNSVSNTISVLLANGLGGFGAHTDFAVGGNPRCVAMGDFNGDGKRDVAVANAAANSVSVLLGDGLGGFGPQASFSVGTAPQFVAIGDLNGDGKLDLVTVNLTTHNVSVLLGDGLGGFSSHVDFATGGQPQCVAIGDLDGDGNPDLVTANFGANKVSVLLGDGLGGFGPHTDVGVGVNPQFVALSDLNDDGKLDLTVANFNSGTVSVLLGDGNGGWSSNTPFNVGNNPYSIAIGDVNADGKLDLVVANSGIHTVSVLLGDGLGGFGAQTQFDVGFDPQSVAIGDLSGDGKRDIVAAVHGMNMVVVLPGNGHGGFGSDHFDMPNTAGFIATADLNGDGKLDLVAVGAGVTPPALASVLLGDGHGGFGAAASFAVGGTSGVGALADLNGDGKLDLVMTNPNNLPIIIPGTVAVLLGDGLGGFGAHTDFTVGINPHAVAVGDLNGDGNPDLVVTDVGYIPNGGLGDVAVLLGDGHGGFGPATLFTGYYQPWGVAIADLNGDGFLDVVVTEDVGGSLAGEVAVALGDGVGGLRPPTYYTVGFEPSGIAIGDVNGDGKLDVAAANFGVGNMPGTVSVLLGDGLGHLGAQTVFATGPSPSAVAIRDLNGDGLPDLVVTNWGSNTFTVLLGDGHGSFGNRSDFVTGDHPESIAVGDMNGDGRADVAIAAIFANYVTVCLNHGPGTSFFEFCYGDEVAADHCPCGNVGVGGHGCQNSASTGGATLSASGNTSPDSVVLAAQGELPSVLSIFLQGDVAILPAAFGDGLRCAGGSLRRLYVHNASGGAVSAPQGGDPSISSRSAALGDPIAPGSTRFYQVYYRDPSLTFCPSPAGNTWNVGNAVAISW